MQETLHLIITIHPLLNIDAVISGNSYSGKLFMHPHDEVLTSNALSSKMANSRNVIIAIIINIALLATSAQLLSIQYINKYLISTTIPIISSAITICYLSLVYTPKQERTISSGKLVCYCLSGILVWATINFPHISWNQHIKPKHYTLFISYGTAAKVYFLMMMCVIGPIVEEIQFRLYFYSMIRDDFNIPTGVIVSAFLFMLSHGLHITPQSWLYYFIPGVICAVVYEKTKTIWASITVHGISNLIWFSLVYYA